ncbi:MULTISPECIES: PA2779 family protein [Marinobacter]|uniref:PA2779 family protein n=1 Tax=Marinobacter TaxID=2742 RepID=UPI0020051C1B|nr:MULTISPECIES: PA2779 family protein [Marinobacter]MCK7551302.1 PA2779 family protein [Marinobacter goseongensis]MDV3504931.1 PA2779 family protein [Marinobacter sp. M-5]
MQAIRKNLRHVSFFLAILMAMTTVWSSAATADVIGTGELLTEQRADIDRESLLSMLEQQEVKDKLADMGVSQEVVEERIQNLTPAELAEFEQQLAQAEVGEGVVGIIVLFLLVFIITDMLCATNIFSFINCIR